MMASELKIVWWNVNLSPPASAGRNKASEEKKANVANIVVSLMLEKYDYICLSEVSLEDIRSFSDKIHENGYNFTDVIEHIGNNRYFDTCIIFQKSNEIVKFNGCDSLYDLYPWDNSLLKVGQLYQFFDSKLDNFLTFFVSHWPSLLNDNRAEINQISFNLRKWINDYIDDGYAILIGDYNQEPYSEYIVENLQVSREKEYVIAHQHLFYNPCWKLFNSNSNLKGTTKCRQTRFRDWSLIDQVMISSHFLTRSWIFSDDDLHIIDENTINQLTQNRISENPSDHYPLAFKFIKVN